MQGMGKGADNSKSRIGVMSPQEVVFVFLVFIGLTFFWSFHWLFLSVEFNSSLLLYKLPSAILLLHNFYTFAGRPGTRTSSSA